ncbi:MAG: phenylacetate--CoA ligase family protein [Armatimonadota bacterium]
MSSWLFQVYNSLPPWARSTAASVRGAYLRSWRYGHDSDRLVEEAHERERWSEEQWHAWREERLAYVLHRAATRVPYYREQWTRRRAHGDRSSWEALENWPVLEKEALRERPEAFVADDCDRGRMFHLQTSGTTGKPIHLWRSRETVRALYALSAARARGWHGARRGDRYAMLGGQMVVPLAQRKPPFWVWNASLGQLYMSTFHLAPDLIPFYLEALVRYRISHFYGYTSSLHALALEVLRLGRRDLRMTVAITNAEPLSEEQRRVISEAFQCRVCETYGMGELTAAASECEAGHLHQWPEVGWVERLEGVAPAPPGESGDLVGTGLLNADMPLIRYRIGDRGHPVEPGPPCACGRGLPLFGRIEGRNSDLLITRDGRKVFWLNPVFYGLPLRQSQIIQESLDRIRVRYVPADGFDDASARTLVERLQARVGEVAVSLEEMADIPRGPNGKFQPVICLLSPEERTHARPEAVGGQPTVSH